MERSNKSAPSLKLQEFIGAYENKMLGTGTVSVVNNKLQINFNDFINYNLEHWHYNTFKTNKDPRFYEKLEVRFELNNDGKSSNFNIMGELFTKTE